MLQPLVESANPPAAGGLRPELGNFVNFINKQDSFMYLIWWDLGVCYAREGIFVQLCTPPFSQPWSTESFDFKVD